MRPFSLGQEDSETPGELIDEDTFVNISDVIDVFNDALYAVKWVGNTGSRNRRALSIWQNRNPPWETFGRTNHTAQSGSGQGSSDRDHAAGTGQAIPAKANLLTKHPDRPGLRCTRSSIPLTASLLAAKACSGQPGGPPDTVRRELSNPINTVVRRMDLVDTRLWAFVGNRS